MMIDDNEPQWRDWPDHLDDFATRPKTARETEAEMLPPFSKHAEENVIGSVLKQGAVLAQVYGRLKPEHFFSIRFRTIYAAMLALFDNGVAIDIGTLHAELESKGLLDPVGGFLGLVDINLAVPSSAHIEHYAAEVEHLAMRRQLASAGNDIFQAAMKVASPLTADASAELLQSAQTKLIHAGGTAYQRKILLPAEWVGNYYEHVQSVNGENGTLGLSTGFITLDRLWLGLQPGLNILAARPGFGKSELAWNLALNAGMSRRAANTKCAASTGWTLFVSIEMTDTELAERATAGEAGVSKEKLIYGRFSPTDAQHIGDTLEQLEASRIALVVETGITSHDVRAFALQHEARTGPIDLIVVDYLQLLSDKSGREGNRNYDLGQAAKNLKDLSKELDCTVLATAQLNRGVDARPPGSREPLLSDLRDSGELEQHCNIATFIYRGDRYGDEGWTPGTARILNRKHRRWGALGNSAAMMIYTGDAYHDYAVPSY